MESNIQIVNDDSKKKLGAPSKFDPSYCDVIAKVAAEGGHIAAMMRAIGIGSKETWYEWQRKHPEFKQAVENAETISQELYEKIGLKAIMGEIPNFSATTYALVMNNKFGKDYKRNPTATEVNITNNTLNLTSEQVQQKIAQKIEKLKSLGVDIEHSN